MALLNAAIDQLYAAFADVDRPTSIAYCPCCKNQDELQPLLSQSLRTIAASQLYSYAASALLTVGSEADYLYFLPRILELSMTDELGWPEPEITGQKVNKTRLSERPITRREAISDLLRCKLKTLLNPDRHGELDSWMCAIGCMGLETRPYLEIIGTSPTAVLAYFDDNATTLNQHKLANSFWELPNKGHDHIVKWFHSRPIRSQLFEAYGVVLEPM